MESGPTLCGETRRPRALYAAISPVATDVFPALLPGAASTTRGTAMLTDVVLRRRPGSCGRRHVTTRRCGRPELPTRRARSPLDPPLALLAGVHRVLDLGHLDDQVGGLDELRVRVATGYDDVLVARPVHQGLDHLVDVHPAPLHRVGELVEHVERVRLSGQVAADLRPALRGVGGVVDLGALPARPAPPAAHLVPDDGAALAGLLVQPAECGQRVLLADPPLGALDELVDRDGPALVPGAHRHAERGGGLAFHLAGVDGEPRPVPALPRAQPVVGDDGDLSLRHVRPPSARTGRWGPAPLRPAPPGGGSARPGRGRARRRAPAGPGPTRSRRRRPPSPPRPAVRRRRARRRGGSRRVSRWPGRAGRRGAADGAGDRGPAPPAAPRGRAAGPRPAACGLRWGGRSAGPRPPPPTTWAGARPRRRTPGRSPARPCPAAGRRRAAARGRRPSPRPSGPASPTSRWRRPRTARDCPRGPPASPGGGPPVRGAGPVRCGRARPGAVPRRARCRPGAAS